MRRQYRITVQELPRVVLVGAPGGGKTIFLTRIAAAMAQACLGRGGDFEPDLDVELLRRDFALPVPIVVEATRIAAHDTTTATALVQAILDETSSVGTKPDEHEIESGLESGRFLLLVDALDEIADANDRSSVLMLLKGVSRLYRQTRIIITTRSARYTGDLRFGPEFVTVEVAPLNKGQVTDLCENWTRIRGRDDEYRNSLLNAAWGLADKVGGTPDDQALTGNPLMLTAICMVFERYHTLPDDRGRLCELLIGDLCSSRRSEDTDRGWKLDDVQKQDLLQRIALAMQEEGAQSWPVKKGIGVAMELVPSADSAREHRAKRYVDWASDHTGILRFFEGSDGEQIRFWHRIFREYLAAKRIAQQDTTAENKIKELWEKGRLCDPFWQEVIRLLPRTLGTIEKPTSLRESLEKLADEDPNHKGRILALAAAGIIENRDLFPKVNFSEMAERMAREYDRDALSWPLSDRLLFLESLGRLDPRNSDPRLQNEHWIPISAVETIAPGAQDRLFAKPSDLPSAGALSSSCISKYLVTVQEIQQFLNAPDFLDPKLWEGLPPLVFKYRGTLKARIEPQYRHPNSPVVWFGVGEAIAYCRWKTRHRKDGKFVRLVTTSELHDLMTRHQHKYWWGNDDLQNGSDPIGNMQTTGIMRPSPVGAFRAHSSGLYDLFGNVWEWCLDTRSTKSTRHRRFKVYGGCFAIEPASFLAGGTIDGLYPMARMHYEGHFSIGFRTILGSFDMSISSLDFARESDLAAETSIENDA